MIDSKDFDITALAHQFKAIGDPTRLQILALLGENEHCVCELQSAINIPGNLLSHHLKVLRKAGLIEANKRGRWIDYRINQKALAALRQSLPPRLQTFTTCTNNSSTKEVVA